MGFFGGDSDSTTNVTNRTENSNLALSDSDSNQLINDSANVTITDGGSTARSLIATGNTVSKAFDFGTSSLDFAESSLDTTVDASRYYFSQATDLMRYNNDATSKLQSQTLGLAGQIASSAVSKADGLANRSIDVVAENATSESTRTINKFVYLLFGIGALGTIIFVAR